MITLAFAVTAAIATGPVALLGHRQIRRHALGKELRIDTPNGISEAGFVRIGGIDMWVEIRGENRANPVLLELHGGPGASNTYFANRTRAWERHFTIVRWDMRGTGKTFGRGDQGEFTIERMLADAVEVTHYVRQRLHKDKVLLVASSFGSVLGLHLARNHPELYSAYVGTDQNICGGDRDARQYRDTVQRLRASGKDSAAAKLERIGADPSKWTGAEWGELAKATAWADPMLRDILKKLILKSMWFSPQHTLRDLKTAGEAQKFSERLGVQSVGMDARRDGTRFELPFFLFQGEHDSLVPAERARRYFDEVQAPHKEFALISNANHFASFWQPGQFLELLVTRVLPLLPAESEGAGPLG